MLVLSPQPAMHRDLHPQEGALNLFFDKIKDKTLLKDFDHQIISKVNTFKTMDVMKDQTHYESPRDLLNETAPIKHI